MNNSEIARRYIVGEIYPLTLDIACEPFMHASTTKSGRELVFTGGPYSGPQLLSYNQALWRYHEEQTARALTASDGQLLTSEYMRRVLNPETVVADFGHFIDTHLQQAEAKGQPDQVFQEAKIVFDNAHKERGEKGE